MRRATGLATESDDLGLWPGKRDERIYIFVLSGQLRRSERLRRALARGERLSGSWQLVSLRFVRPELGHNEFGLQLLSQDSLVIQHFMPQSQRFVQPIDSYKFVFVRRNVTAQNVIKKLVKLLLNPYNAELFLYKP